MHFFIEKFESGSIWLSFQCINQSKYLFSDLITRIRASMWNVYGIRYTGPKLSVCLSINYKRGNEAYLHIHYTWSRMCTLHIFSMGFNSRSNKIFLFPLKKKNIFFHFPDILNEYKDPWKRTWITFLSCVNGCLVSMGRMMIVCTIRWLLNRYYEEKWHAINELTLRFCMDTRITTILNVTIRRNRCAFSIQVNGRNHSHLGFFSFPGGVSSLL